MQTAMQTRRSPWLDRLIADPDKAVDSLLRGVAHLPELQRASPVEAALALMDEVMEDAPERALLDQALCQWLQRRRTSAETLVERPGGVHRFIRETGEAYRMAWRLNLPESSAWIRDNLPDLLRWADGFAQDSTFDLGRAVLAAGAHLQRDKELRFLWFRVCEEAATARLRHRLDTALLGLTRMPDGKTGGPPQDVFVGLARWASRLPDNDRVKGEVIREWRAFKAAFPRQPQFWRGRWQAILEDDRYNHPFTQWLKEADPALQTKASAPKREPLLPKNIPGTIKEFERNVSENGLSDVLWRQMTPLLDQIERYADLTGNSYYLVTSCTSIAKIVLPYAPGSALALARRALLWAPSDGHAWSVRARALERLGRVDLATSVLWEGMRRAPSNPALPHQLALLLSGNGATADAEAEVLLRKANAIDPDHKQSHNDLARLLWATGRADAGIDLLRRFVERRVDAVLLYTLGSLLVAEGRVNEAGEVLDAYWLRFGSDARTATLQRLIAAGVAGQEEECRHLLSARRGQEPDQPRMPWDAIAADSAMAVENDESRRLGRIGTVTEADLLFRIGEAAKEEASSRIDRVLTDDDSDAYAQLVKTLAVPEHRLALEGRAGRFEGSLPLQLALIPTDAPAERWNSLRERFLDGRPLISLVKLSRGIASDDDNRFLNAWATSPTRWDESWAEFLKRQLRGHLMEDSEPLVDLSTLTHDALIQAVDVGWDATPRAA